MIKKEKNNYINTLIIGEEKGHCKGIRQRLDARYRQKQSLDKHR